MDFKKLLPHVYAAVVLFAVAVIFFAPNFFNGKVLRQPDNDKARAIQSEIQDYIKKEGRAPLWTNSLFGGMPSFQIYTTPQGNLIKPLSKAAFFGTDSTGVWAALFTAMLCMYFLLATLKLDWRAAVFGALAFGVTTYNVDILEAGHSTKMAALAFTPAMLAGTIMLFNGRFLAGTAVLALFSAMQIAVNHVQITYYTLLLMGIYGLGQLVVAIREKSAGVWVKAAALSAAALILGVGSNMSSVWPTYEYGQESIRGGSELKSKAAQGGGLTKDYLFNWSCGVCESSSLLVPHATGGGGGESYAETSLFSMLSRNIPEGMTPAQLEQQVGGLMYTGDQPFVGTAIYYGIIAVFLFFMGAFLVEGNLKWWLVAGGLFMVSLAWGKNFFLNDLLFKYFPLFNKFRAVTMAFGLGQLCVAALGAVALQRLADAGISADRKKRALFISAGLTALLCLVAIVCAPAEGPHDNMLDGNPAMLKALQKDRSSFLYGDVYRSLGFLAVAAGLIWLYLKGTLKAGLMILAVAALALGDHWMVCRRTVNDGKFVPKKVATSIPPQTQYDKQIKSDTDPHFRVFDGSGGSIATNFYPSFYHKNIGGYHAAKMQRFQEVVDTFLSSPDLTSSMHILGMFNVKYFLYQDHLNYNPKACGNAWFVTKYTVVPDGDTELASLRNLNPRSEAVVQEKYAGQLQGLNILPDTTATIRLTKYHPERMEYEYSAESEQLAVFSEVYYPPSKGWKCYLNGQPAPDFIKADYVLRALRLPPGKQQKLEMRFEPQSYILGEKISFAASGLTLLLCLGGLFLWYKGGAGFPGATPLSDPEAPARPQAPAAPAGKKKK